MRFRLKVVPAIEPKTRHKLEKVLNKSGFTVLGGGQSVDESYISFENYVRKHRYVCKSNDTVLTLISDEDNDELIDELCVSDCIEEAWSIIEFEDLCFALKERGYVVKKERI